MSKELGERLGVAEAILRVLSVGSLRRIALEKRVLRGGSDVSYACFEGWFAFLCRDGDIEKSSSAHLAPYRITKKGEAFLVWRALCRLEDIKS